MMSKITKSHNKLYCPRCFLRIHVDYRKEPCELHQIMNIADGLREYPWKNYVEDGIAVDIPSDDYSFKMQVAMLIHRLIGWGYLPKMNKGVTE